MMTRLERRSLLKYGAVTVAGLCLSGGFLAASGRGGVFVVDRRFAVSEAFARDRRSRGAMVVDPRKDDLGTSWRGSIPTWLAHDEAIVEGVTLWSDFIICEAFGRTFGLRLGELPRPAAPIVETGLHHWLLLRGGGNALVSGLPA